jgi:hypothetical protein
MLKNSKVSHKTIFPPLVLVAVAHEYRRPTNTPPAMLLERFIAHDQAAFSGGS